MSPHPVYTPTPPPTGRSAEELRGIAWGRSSPKKRAEVEASEREMRRREENEERDRLRNEELEKRRREEDREREERAAAQDLVVDFRDSLSQDGKALPPWGHYYSFHTRGTITPFTSRARPG